MQMKYYSVTRKVIFPAAYPFHIPFSHPGVIVELHCGDVGLHPTNLATARSTSRHYLKSVSAMIISTTAIMGAPIGQTLFSSSNTPRPLPASYGV